MTTYLDSFDTVRYGAGAGQSYLVIFGILGAKDPNQTAISIALAIIVTGSAGITCFKRHKRKQKEYYDRFRSKNDN